MKAVLLLLSLAMVEVVVRIAAYAGLCQIRTFATADRTGKFLFVSDIDPHFGVWHKPGAVVTVATPRGPVSYRTNSHGMRDRSRLERSTAAERVVVLGDSFIEGVYVGESDRLTDNLEKRTGVEFLNFGTSGSFGSIQEWMLYKHLASRFDHTRVCLFLLPDNDFADNDPARNPSARYRPYLHKVGDSYEVTYPVSFDKRLEHLPDLTWGRKIRNRVYNHWYTLNLMIDRDFSSLINPQHKKPVLSAYDTYGQEDLDRLLFTCRQIAALANPRNVCIFVIPRDRDFIAYETGHFKGRIIKDLVPLTGEAPNVKVVDLLPHFVAYMKTHSVSYRDFFLGFDPHWSPLGHQVAADAVLHTLRENGFTSTINP